MSSLTPAEIVTQLDRYIVGQDDAKRVVAIALRNRWRRLQLTEEMRVEVQPKNILMIGPTGVGKTEIARRVAKILHAPFIKVDATTFTEVGYVGRDVESIVRELVEAAIAMIQSEQLEAVKDEATGIATERLVELLLAQSATKPAKNGSAPHGESEPSPEVELSPAARRNVARRKKKIVDMLSRDALEDQSVEVDLDADYDTPGPHVEIVTGVSADRLHESVRDFIDAMTPSRKPRKMSVRDARRVLAQQEAQRLVDFDDVVEEALRRVQDSGVVFIDEIDKTIHNSDYGLDVSGEGVQRDLLPIVEGASVMTRHGPVRTDHILFVAAGSFSTSKPSDLIPELQGRFPLRVELDSLDEADLYAILTEPENALTRQYSALLAAEGVELSFAEDGLHEVARLAAEVNARTEDIGARRLGTIVERVLEEVSFDAPTMTGGSVLIDAEYVIARTGDIAADDDLSSAIL